MDLLLSSVFFHFMNVLLRNMFFYSFTQLFVTSFSLVQTIQPGKGCLGTEILKLYKNEMLFSPMYKLGIKLNVGYL